KGKCLLIIEYQLAKHARGDAQIMLIDTSREDKNEVAFWKCDLSCDQRFIFPVSGERELKRSVSWIIERGELKFFPQRFPRPGVGAVDNGLVKAADEQTGQIPVIGQLFCEHFLGDDRGHR